MFTSWLRKWMHKPSRPARARRPRLQLEYLEDRRLLATFLWTNRGNDGFDTVFIGPGQAEAARRVVDAALQAWDVNILHFNYYHDPNDPPLPDEFVLAISMDSQTGLGAHAEVGVTDDDNPDDMEKPTSGNILIQSGLDGHGAGWYIDPQPQDSAEFRGPIINAYAANATPGGPADGLADLFTAVVSEVTATLGINADDDETFTETPLFMSGAVQPDAAVNPGEGNLYEFSSPSVNALFTSNQGGAGGEDVGSPLHIAEPVPGNQDGPFYGVQDSANGVFELGRRYLPSLVDELVLQDVYGYTFYSSQSGLDMFYANLDTTTGNLLVRGGELGESVYGPTNNSNDHITLIRSQEELMVRVDVGSDVPGTGTTAAFVNVFNFQDVQSITIQAEDGIDDVTLDLRNGNVVPAGGLSVDGGTGHDALHIFSSAASDTFELTGNQVILGGDVLSGTISYTNTEFLGINGGDGANQFNLQSAAADVASLILIGGADSDQFVVAGTSSLQHLGIIAEGGDDSIAIDSSAPGTQVFVAGDAGSDTILLCPTSHNLNGLQGSFMVDGGAADHDTLELHDEANTLNKAYKITDQLVGDGFSSFFYTGLEVLTLDAGGGNNRVNVQATAPGTTTNVLGGPHSDAISIDSNGATADGTVDLVLSPVTIDGGGGTNTLTLQDASDGTFDHVTVTDHAVGEGTGDTFFGAGGGLEYTGLTALILYGNFGGSFIQVISTASGAPTTINTGRGTNLIWVGGGSPAGDSSGAVVDGVRSRLTINGMDGTNNLVVNDPANVTADRVTLTADHIGAAPGDTFFGPGGSLVYTLMNTLTVKGGAGGNVILVTAVNAFTATEVDAGAGNDAVRVDSNGLAAGGTVDTIHNSLVISGQGGLNQLTVENASDYAPRTATVTADQVGAATGDTLFGTGGSLTYSFLDTLTIDNGTGNDTIYVRATAPATTTVVNAGPGADLIAVDSNGPAPGGMVKTIVSTLLVNGQGGGDLLGLEDPSDNSANQVTLTGTQVGAAAGDSFFGAGGSLGYSGLGILKLDDGPGGNTVYVNATAPLVDTRLNTGAGGDAVLLGNAAGHTVDGIVSKLTINGQSGGNVLVLDDANDTTADRVTLTAMNVGAGPGDTFFGPGGRLTYSNFKVLALAGGTGADRINVRSTWATTATFVLAGAGDDVITVDSNGPSSPGGTVDGVVSSLTVKGGPGTNHLVLQDASDNSGDTVTVTADQVGAAPGDTFFGPGGGLKYGEIAVLSLYGGSGGNAITVEATAAGAATGILAGKGNDTLRVDSNGAAPGGTVDGVVSLLEISGGGGTDSLTLEDSSDVTADHVTINDTQVGAAASDTFFGTGGKLTYDSLNMLVVNGGSGGNSFDVSGQAPGTAMTLATGSGADTITVRVANTSAYHQFLVDGGAGGDLLQIIDVSGDGVITNHPGGPGFGYEQVDYSGGLSSRIDYQNLETVLP